MSVAEIRARVAETNMIMAAEALDGREDLERTRQERVLRMVRVRLLGGHLPWHRHERAWQMPASGRPCAGCTRVIPETEQEIETAFLHEGILRFHPECFGIWDRAREDQGIAPPRSPAAQRFAQDGQLR